MASLRSLTVAGLLLLGCRMDNPAFDERETERETSGSDGVETQADEGMDSQADTGDGDGDGDGDTTGDTTGDGDGDTTGDGDGEPGTSDTTTGDGDGDGDGVCPTLPFGDPDCNQCLTDNCCSQLTICLANPTCACMFECLSSGELLDQCNVTCQIDVNVTIPDLGSVMECSQQLCFEVCA